MIIRKLFKFEGAHVVRNCFSDRCKFSIHGHSYQVEVFLESRSLDNAQMVLDFGILKYQVKDFIDSFDHCWAYWSKESDEFKDFVHKHSQRWVELPVNVSAEALAVLFYGVIQGILDNSSFENGNRSNVSLHSVRVHETDTGYAEAFNHDLYDILNKYLKEFEGTHVISRSINSIIFSPQIRAEWRDSLMWDRLKNNEVFTYNKPVQQM